jgi:hypothetical protein
MTFDEQIKLLTVAYVNNPLAKWDKHTSIGAEYGFRAGANAAREILRGAMLVKAGDINRKVETELIIAYDKIEKLRADLQIAVQYLKEGKIKFAPNTTNSFVDDFIAKHEAKIKGGSE